MWKYVALGRPSPSSDPSFRWLLSQSFSGDPLKGGITTISLYRGGYRDSGWKLVQGHRALKGNSETGSERVSDQTEVTQQTCCLCSL